VECRRCGLIYVNPRFKASVMNQRFSRKYFVEEYLPTFEKIREERVRKYGEILSELQPYKKSGRLFDIGCGPGFFIAEARNAGWTASGCETASFAVDYGKRELGIDIRSGDFMALDLPGNYFDVITLWDVLEHLPHPVKMLEKAVSCLSEGGTLVICTPNLKGPSFLSEGKNWAFIGPSEHVYYFTPETLTALLKTLGLSVVRLDAVDDDMLLIARSAREARETPGKGKALPAVSVIVLNFNGKDLLADCFDSLRNMTYPKEKTELIMVDNGSDDESAAFMKARYPEVKLTINHENGGFALPNNQAAQNAKGDLVFFLNNDMKVAPDCLEKLVASIASEPGIVASCPKILNWSGDRIDFAGAGINFEGKGFQQGYGSQRIYKFCEESDLIFGNGGALCIKRIPFLDAGGFDPLYFAYYEDVDLGWRLAVRGEKIRFSPLSLVYHKHNATSARFPMEIKKFHMERNALFSILKNYSDDTLPDMVASSLLLGVCRTLYSGGEDPFEETGEPSPRVFSQKLRKLVKASPSYYPAAVADVLGKMDAVAENRKRVQSSRRVKDRAVLSRFGEETTPSPSSRQQSYNRHQENVVNAFGLKRRFSGGKQGRVLMLTHEVFGEHLSGPAIRVFEIARVLSAEFRVTISSPGPPALTSSFCTFHRHTPGEAASLRDVLKKSDLLMIQGHKIEEFPDLKQWEKPVVVDLFCPFSLENLEFEREKGEGLDRRKKSWRRDLSVLRDQLEAGDFFICASEIQRDFWIGNLHAAGRLTPIVYSEDPALRHLIDVVPFGMPDTPPVREKPVVKGVVEGIREKDILLLWGGSILNWQDPLTLIKAMKIISEKRDDVKLFFMGTEHPNPLVPRMDMVEKAKEMAEALGVKDRSVFFNAWVPYLERAGYLLEADLGICTHRHTLETRYAFRTRLLDCLWACLPMVVTRGDYFSDLIDREGLGRTVPAEDPGRLSEAILSLAGQRDALGICISKIKQVRQDYTWEKAAAPLLRFCRDPWKRASEKDGQAGSAGAIRTGLGSVELKFNLSEKTRERIKNSFAGKMFVRTRDAYRHRFAPGLTISDIRGGQTQGQTFTARENNLYRIDVQLATYNLAGNFPLIFHLREGPGGTRDLVTVVTDTAGIEANMFNAFSFPPIPGAKGKPYYFFIECPDGRPNNAPAVWIHPREKDPRGGHRFRRGRKAKGRIIFEDFYKTI